MCWILNKPPNDLKLLQYYRKRIYIQTHKYMNILFDITTDDIVHMMDKKNAAHLVFDYITRPNKNHSLAL